MRFFSPPEKPTLRARRIMPSSIPSAARFSLISFRNSIASYSFSPRCLRAALTAVLKKVALPTPGISTGYWKARKTPESARSSTLMASRSSPW